MLISSESICQFHRLLYDTAPRNTRPIGVLALLSPRCSSLDLFDRILVGHKDAVLLFKNLEGSRMPPVERWSFGDGQLQPVISGFDRLVQFRIGLDRKCERVGHWRTRRITAARLSQDHALGLVLVGYLDLAGDFASPNAICPFGAAAVADDLDQTNLQRFSFDRDLTDWAPAQTPARCLPTSRPNGLHTLPELGWPQPAAKTAAQTDKRRIKLRCAAGTFIKVFDLFILNRLISF